MPSTLTDQALSPETIRALDAVIDRHAATRGAVIPVLQEAQEQIGYLPPEAIHRVGDRLGVPYSVVAGVVTFYSYFTTVPRGKHTVRVCLGTACYVRGGKSVLEGFRRTLGVDVGTTTEDRCFSLEVGRCFGACGLAPVVMVDEDTHQRVNPNRVDDVVRLYREGEDE